MANTGSQVFTCLVVGDNPNELMSKYDMNLEVEKYMKYEYLKAEDMKNNSIKILTEIVESPKEFNLNSYQIDSLKDKIKTLTSMSNFEYYSNITSGMYYDKEGNAWTTENPNGKWNTAKMGDYFSLPLILKDGSTAHQARYKDVDWDKMHMQNTHVYEIIWDMIKNGREPLTDKEKLLYENFTSKDNYFSRFKDVDEFIVHNCAYWNYAFLDEHGWKDLDDGGSDVEWVATYFDKFVSNIDENALVTIFECTKNREE